MYSKELIRGTLKPIILKLLAEHGRMYGYEICQKVKELTSNEIIIKEGSLYPALYKLKAEGLVEVESIEVDNRTRQYYSLTDKSQAMAKEQVNEFSLFLLTMSRLFKVSSSY
ncbi:PadR family transcriptional regulator [Rhodocytophaga aerolata]|uniref:PadR family transcriptional regulator n=1 Tax=Rhodocytophaga aerolata TaxID=455078 RepID=A0ABT8QZE5_9BACT|nr:PadR family transcriptional regulator [Rhodocytophaga aerolata]MDO1445214.1 PadR family transcriptional regulator [Rhodocytophaga aerolata]